MSPPTATEPPLNILTFDGGGIRGLSSILVLREIMYKIWAMAVSQDILEEDEEFPVKPCDIFDLIAGSSTGGLIAIMLGRLRMDIDRCYQDYLAIMSEVFNNRNLDTTGMTDEELLERGLSIYDGTLLARKVQDIVASYYGGEAEADTKYQLLGDPMKANACKTFVLGIRHLSADHPPMRLKTYYLPHAHYEIGEVVRATTAARPFFDPVNLGYPPLTFQDSKLGYNNPTKEALAEADEIWGRHRPMGVLLSIGSGNTRKVYRHGADASNLRVVYQKLLEGCKNVANEVYYDFPWSEHCPYFRFSVDRGLLNTPDDECSKEQQLLLTAVTSGWLEMESQDIVRCAKALMPRVIEFIQSRRPLKQQSQNSGHQ